MGSRDDTPSGPPGGTTCYCKATLILTEHGEVAVEDLAIGDRIVTRFGGIRSIKWIGRRSYNGRFIIGQKDALPIVIKAGALETDTPRRDLWVSPHHAMLLDGLLIEARDLVNGTTIIQMQSVESVDYFHIEFEEHDAMLAEGAWAESFLDDDNRNLFQNAEDYAALYPGDLDRVQPYCAPRLDSGEEMQRIRDRLRARAVAGDSLKAKVVG